MPASIGATPETALLRIFWQGSYNEKAQNVVSVDGSVADADIEQFFDDLEAVTYAGIYAANASFVRQITGVDETPDFASVLSQVNEILILTFTRAHPLNAAITVTRSFQLRAPNTTIVNDTNGKPVVASVVGDRSSADENLRGLISFLEANLTFEDITGDITVGGWTYDESRSGKLGTAAIVGDG